MKYNNPIGDVKFKENRGEYGIYVDKVNHEFIKVYQCIDGCIENNKQKKHIVNQYFMPIEVFEFMTGENLHLNSFGKTFVYSINEYENNGNDELILRRKNDIVRNSLGNVKSVHYHNEKVILKKKKKCKDDSDEKPKKKAIIIHDKRHHVDEKSKKLKKKLRK